MVSESSKWELGFVHYIKKFTISRFVISRVYNYINIPDDEKTVSGWLVGSTLEYSLP